MIRKLSSILVLCALLVPVLGYADFDRHIFKLWSGTANVDTTAVGMADSSNVVYTFGAQRMTLMLKPNRPCRVAIEVLTYGDSLSETILDAAATDTTKASVWSWRCPVYASNDTLLSVLPANTPTSVVPASWEYTIEFPNSDPAAGRKWGSARQQVIDLYRPCDNHWCTADKVQIRYRILSAGGVVTMTGTLKTYTW